MSELARIESDVLRIGFEMGYFGKSDVARWADRQIDATDKPSFELIELSMNEKVDPHDLLKYLVVLGHAGPAQQTETKIGFIGLLIHSHRVTVEWAIRALWSLADDDGVTDDQRTEFAYLDDGHELAIAGVQGTVEEVGQQLHEFVTPYAEALEKEHPTLFNSLGS